MKKITLSLAVLLMVTTAQAGGIWDMVKNSSSSGTLQSKQYTIEVSGTNTRGYVLDVPEMKSVCFLTYSSKGHPAMDCKTYKEMGVEK